MKPETYNGKTRDNYVSKQERNWHILTENNDIW